MLVQFEPNAFSVRFKLKKDGELISFAETLDLMKITRLIETARKEAIR